MGAKRATCHQRFRMDGQSDGHTEQMDNKFGEVAPKKSRGGNIPPRFPIIFSWKSLWGSNPKIAPTNYFGLDCAISKTTFKFMDQVTRSSIFLDFQLMIHTRYISWLGKDFVTLCILIFLSSPATKLLQLQLERGRKMRIISHFHQTISALSSPPPQTKISFSYSQRCNF